MEGVGQESSQWRRELWQAYQWICSAFGTKGWAMNFSKSVLVVMSEENVSHISDKCIVSHNMRILTVCMVHMLWEN